MLLAQSVELLPAKGQHEHLGPEDDVAGDVANFLAITALVVLGQVEFSASEAADLHLPDPVDSDIHWYPAERLDRFGLNFGVVCTEVDRVPILWSHQC